MIRVQPGYRAKGAFLARIGNGWAITIQTPAPLADVCLSFSQRSDTRLLLLVSTDNEVTYTGTDLVNNPTAVVDPANAGGLHWAFHYKPGATGTSTFRGTARPWFSTDGGVTFVGRARPACVEGNFFANIAIDTAEIFGRGWTTGCSTPATTPCKAFVAYSTNEGQTWSTPRQVNTGAGSPTGTSPDLRQMLFPWTVVGDPGRVVIVYYATTDTFPGTADFPAEKMRLWHTLHVH